MKKAFQYLYDELIKDGRSRTSALIDVALIAMGEVSNEVSDEACRIITSEKYLKIKISE
jgi:hypothetical protein